jgi:hypothetical protein
MVGFMKFKIGDKIRMKSYCSGIEQGQICILFRDNNEVWANPYGKFRESDGGHGCHCQEKWEFISSAVDLREAIL